MNSPPFASIESAESDSWQEIMQFASEDFRGPFGADVQRVSGAVVFTAPRSDILALNRAWLPGTSTRPVQELVDDIIEHTRFARVKKLLVHCPSWAASSDVFTTRGFKVVTPMAKMYRRATLDIQSDCPFRIAVIGRTESELFGRVAAIGNDAPPSMAPGFNSTVGLPGWRHYIAFSGDEPVAAAGMRVFEDVAWCCFAGTIPSHRRRGAQTALLARRIRDAASAGCTWVTCESQAKSATDPGDSLRNMGRVGFNAAYDRPSYLKDLVASG